MHAAVVLAVGETGDTEAVEPALGGTGGVVPDGVRSGVFGDVRRLGLERRQGSSEATLRGHTFRMAPAGLMRASVPSTPYRSAPRRSVPDAMLGPFRARQPFPIADLRSYAAHRPPASRGAGDVEPQYRVERDFVVYDFADDPSEVGDASCLREGCEMRRSEKGRARWGEGGRIGE